MIEWWKKLRGGSGKAPDDKPTVHFTETGGWYVDPDELLRSEPVRKEIEKWAELAKRSGIADTEGRSDANTQVDQGQGTQAPDR